MPRHLEATIGLGDHWVQITETRLAGQHRGEGPEQRVFAAVTCSKRCAIAVLSEPAEVEEAQARAERERMDRTFPTA